MLAQLDRTGALRWSSQRLRSPGETKVSGSSLAAGSGSVYSVVSWWGWVGSTPDGLLGLEPLQMCVCVCLVDVG